LKKDAASLALDFDPEPGVHHGSRWADGFSDRLALAYQDENREAFGALDVLYSWTYCAGDHQWIYRLEEPHEVLSVDHTVFFGGAPEWDETSLTGTPAVASDPMFDPVRLRHQDRAAALEKLEALTPANLAEIVAAPPTDWGVTASARQALAHYLADRRDGVLGLYA
jgi:hypothetical protein